MTFNDWYETYERDGGELMLYNTIDLEAAWNASRALTIASVQALPQRAMFDAGYQRGYEAAKKQAVGICKNGVPTAWGFTSSAELSCAIAQMQPEEVNEHIERR